MDMKRLIWPQSSKLHVRFSEVYLSGKYDGCFIFHFAIALFLYSRSSLISHRLLGKDFKYRTPSQYAKGEVNNLYQWAENHSYVELMLKQTTDKKTIKPTKIRANEGQ
jgi:hypothetical protein